MAHSFAFRILILLLVAAGVAHAIPASAENWVDAEPGQVDLESLRREGSVVYYHSRTGKIWPHGEYRVDCSQVNASEVAIETMNDGAWRERRLPSNTIGVGIARYACSLI